MNLMTIEVYQNGKKIDTLHGASIEKFESLKTAGDLFSACNGLFNQKLVSTVLLIDADDDGHPETLRSNVVVPEWSDREKALVRQGYLLAMTQIRQSVLWPLHDDGEKVFQLYKILADTEGAVERNADLKPQPYISI